MRIAIASLLLLSSAAANATFVTIDAGNYSAGTNVSHAVQGVTMRGAGQSFSSTYSPTYGDVTVGNCVGENYLCAQNVFALGNASYDPEFWTMASDALRCEQGNSHICRETSFQVLNLYFEAPTEHFSFQSFWGSDSPALYAFDSLGNLAFSCGFYGTGEDCFSSSTQTPTWENRSTLGFTLDGKSISRVMLGFNGGRGTIEAMTVSVPEPGTFALMALVLVGALALPRRRALSASAI